MEFLSPLKNWVEGKVVGLRALGACVTYQLSERERNELSNKGAIDWEAFKYKQFKIKTQPRNQWH